MTALQPPLRDLDTAHGLWVHFPAAPVGQDISLGMLVGIYRVSSDSDWPELLLNPNCSSDSSDPLPDTLALRDRQNSHQGLVQVGYLRLLAVKTWN